MFGYQFQIGANAAAAPSAVFSLWEPLLMLLLLAASAFFSGSETALFNLSRRQRKSMSDSSHGVVRLAARILDAPSSLLGCLLFGNMLVNILFFAVSSVLASRISQRYGVTAGSIAALLSFLILILLGEILPKSLAYANSRAVSVAVALPLYVTMRVLMPVVSICRFLFVEPALRLLLGPVKHPEPITAAEFKILAEQIRKRGLISAEENKLLHEVVELGFLKVRDCLRPRVDMVACSVSEKPEKAIELMRENGLTKLPVYVKNKDNIIGLVELRRIFLEPGKSLDKLVNKVNFVPEQKTIVSLLQFFRTTGTDVAVVVDEYGGIAGYIQLEDIAEEILGPIEPVTGIKPIEQIGPFSYRLAGSLALHDWADVFGIDTTETRFSTIGGLVTAILGRIPKSGDVAYWKNLKFVVERVRKHRIETLVLTLESESNDR